MTTAMPPPQAASVFAARPCPAVRPKFHQQIVRVVRHGGRIALRLMPEALHEAAARARLSRWRSNTNVSARPVEGRTQAARPRPVSTCASNVPDLYGMIDRAQSARFRRQRLRVRAPRTTHASSRPRCIECVTQSGNWNGGRLNRARPSSAKFTSLPISTGDLRFQIVHNTPCRRTCPARWSNT